jgi:hypothetical protein
MDSAPIFFEFDQEKDALLALDTLEELGYKPLLQQGEASKPLLHIHVDEQDLTSALEIAQAHGGRLVDRKESNVSEADVFAMAYDMEGSAIRIPAHIINEDWAEGYAESKAYQNNDGIPTHEEAMFDPSADEYDHFPTGIRM